MRQSLSATFSLPSAIPGPGIIMEQATSAAGRVTRLDLVKSLSGRLYGGHGPQIDCGFRDGRFMIALLVFPSEQTYQVGVTHGHLDQPIISAPAVEESLQFTLTDSATTKYPVRELISLDPLADCWDENGAPIQPPPITWDGTTVTLARKIYGSLLITYRTIRHTMALLIPPRDGSENIYQSVAWAAWNGGAKLLDLKVPSERYADDSGCAWRLTDRWIVNFPDDEIRPPTTDGVSNTVEIDYCTQKVSK